MKEVLIRKPSMVGWKDIKVNVPESFSEMTPEQFIAMCSIGKGEVDERKFIKHFFGITPDLWQSLDMFYVWKLTQMIREIKDDGRCDHFIESYLYVDGIVLEAPFARLKGMSWQQFITADTYFSWWKHTDKDWYLHAFIASLYIADTESFFTVKYDERISLLQKSGGKKTFECIATNWSLIRNWLANVFPYLFPGKIIAEGEKNEQKNEKPASWLDVFDSLVGEDLTRIESYKTLACMDVMRIINNRIKESKKK